MSLETDYQIFTIPKRSGGERQIEAPTDELRKRQKSLLYQFYRCTRVSPFAHAFRKKRNIYTNAYSHSCEHPEYMVAFDIADFFPSIKREPFLEKLDRACYAEHRGSFKKDIVIPNKEFIFHDFEDGKGVRLPQGSPLSPYLSNVYLFSFDWKAAWICYKRDIVYTRYADDIALSGKNKKELWATYYLLVDILKTKFLLEINKKKTRLMQRKSGMGICGLSILEDKPKIKRKWRNRLRAALHNEQGNEEYSPQVKGMLAFKQMVDEGKEVDNNLTICGRILLMKGI